MADSVEMADIRGMEIDKVVKGFALIEYVFKNVCTVTSTSANQIRWYQETAADLTATTPQAVANISPLSVFTTLEPTWTQQNSYVKKYAAEAMISMEDIKSTDIDVVVRTLLRLTRAVVKQVDTRIWNVLTQDQTIAGMTIQHFDVTDVGGFQWDGFAAASGADIIKDIAHAKKMLTDYDYVADGATLFVSGKDYESITRWLISFKGSSIPQYASDKVSNGIVMQLLGVNIRVSNNVSTSGAALVVPGRACTWKSYTDTTSVAIVDPGLGTKFRVWEMGEAILTDPKAVVYLTNTQYS